MHKNEGNAMLEAAIVLPLMLFIAIGLIFLPLTNFFTKTILVDAAREGARHVALWEDESGAYDLVEQILTDNGLDKSNLQDISFDYSTANYVRITVLYRHPTLFPRITKLIGTETLDNYSLLSVSSTFKREGP
ncbi:MAG: pilus assembly protein [Firmicutes bacterium]|nr:pilus assembly protein [Bacillota bacterium]